MAYRNVVRSWLAASVLALSAATPLLAAPTPAGAADNVTITVFVRDDGFSQSTVDAREGDILIFQLDNAAMNSHTLAWDHGQVWFKFDRSRPHGDSRQYGPLDLGNADSAVLHFYDAEHVSGYAAGGPYTGVLTVSKAPPPPPPPPSSTSSTSTTVTAPPSSATTTTTAPTTSTSAPSTVRPFLIPDPAPTTTTTAVSDPANVGAGPVKNGGAAAPTANKDKDKGKGKAAATETPTTAAPAPPAAPPDSIFDAESLTPSPTTLPEASVSDPGDEAALNAASVLSLLDPEKEKAVDDDNARLLLIALGALGLLVVVGGIWLWLQRASRYDPA